VILIPWTFHHLQIALHLSMNRAISIYGLVWSSFMGGRVFGRNIFFGYPGVMTAKLCYLTCSLITFSFLFLAISSRTSVICVCFALIGFGGGVIRTCYPPQDDISSHPRLSIAGTHSISLHQEALALIFAPLFAGLTYNSAATSRFPALVLCLIAACVSSTVFLIQCFSQRRLFWSGSKSKPSVPSGPMKSLLVKPRHNTKKKEVMDVSLVEPPQEFLNLCGGNREAAQKKFHQTLLWRVEADVEAIVDTPQDYFDEILQYYPHGIQGRSRSGGVVCYEVRPFTPSLCDGRPLSSHPSCSKSEEAARVS
jgi:hypothetical protein